MGCRANEMSHNWDVVQMKSHTIEMLRKKKSREGQFLVQTAEYQE